MLKRTTPADRGLIEVPVLTPHLESRRVDDELLLVSETFNTMLKGRIHCELIPLCDGHRTHTEIANSLSPTHSASEVRAAITALASRGVSRVRRLPHGPEPGCVLVVIRCLAELGRATSTRSDGGCHRR